MSIIQKIPYVQRRTISKLLSAMMGGMMLSENRESDGILASLRLACGQGIGASKKNGEGYLAVFYLISRKYMI